MNFAGGNEKGNEVEHQQSKTRASELTFQGAVSPQQTQKEVCREKNKVDKKPPGRLTDDHTCKEMSQTERQVAYVPNNCSMIESTTDGGRPEEQKSLATAGNSPGRGNTIADTEEENEPDLVSPVIGATRVRNAWRGEDACDSTLGMSVDLLDTATIDGCEDASPDNDNVDDPPKRQIDKLPSVVNIFTNADEPESDDWLGPDAKTQLSQRPSDNERDAKVQQDEPTEARPPTATKRSNDDSNLGYDDDGFGCGYNDDNRGDMVTPVEKNETNTSNGHQLGRSNNAESVQELQVNGRELAIVSSAHEEQPHRPRRTLRRSSVSNISLEVSVGAESTDQGHSQGRGRLARRSSLSTVSIKLDFDDASIDTADQNAALLQLINQAVASATANLTVSAECAEVPPKEAEVTKKRPSPRSIMRDITPARDKEQHIGRFQEIRDDATTASYASRQSARERRSTMCHTASLPRTGGRSTESQQPPLSRPNGDTPKYGKQLSPSDIYGYESSHAPGPIGRNPLRKNELGGSNHSSGLRKGGLRKGTSFALRNQSSRNMMQDSRGVTTETTETVSHSIDTSCSMHNIGLHNRHGFMLNDKQAKRTRRSSLSWTSASKDTSESVVVATPAVAIAAPRQVLNRGNSMAVQGSQTTKTDEMRSSLQKRSSSRHLSRGGRPPMDRNSSSRSLLRSRMVRQTSSRSISRTSVISGEDRSEQRGSRRSLLSKNSSTRSISKMTVVYQESSCEMEIDDLSASEFNGDHSVASFNDDDDSIMDCMSKIDQPIHVIEEITEKAGRSKLKTSSSMRSLVSLKSFKSLGKKLGISKKKKKPKKEEAKDNEESAKPSHASTSTQIQRSLSDIFFMKLGSRKVAKPAEPWMMLQSNDCPSPWEDHQDSRMLAPCGGEKGDDARERRMRRRASM